MRRFVTFVATGFGLGLSPVASGTVGSLLGVLIAWPMSGLAVAWQAAICVALAALAIPICDVAEGRFPRKDDGRIVADEYLTFPICMIGLPWNPWVVAMAFVVCRGMDIVKPPPARQLQALHGGLGVVIDDVFSSVYALAANHVLYWLILRFILTDAAG